MDRADIEVEYRSVDGFPGYRVGSDGSVWSSKAGRWSDCAPWKRLNLNLLNTGYYYVYLSRKNPAEVSRRMVHSLVADRFIGPRPTGADINHKDGDKTNNCVTNLEYCTRAENMRHAVAMGLSRGCVPVRQANV